MASPHSITGQGRNVAGRRVSRAQARQLLRPKLLRHPLSVVAGQGSDDTLGQHSSDRSEHI